MNRCTKRQLYVVLSHRPLMPGTRPKGSRRKKTKKYKKTGKKHAGHNKQKKRIPCIK